MEFKDRSFIQGCSLVSESWSECEQSVIGTTYHSHSARLPHSTAVG